MELAVLIVLVLIVITALALIQKQQEATSKLNQAIKDVELNSTDRDAELRFLGLIAGLFLPPDGYQLALTKAWGILENRPSDKSVQELFIQFLKKIPRVAAVDTAYIYRQVLSFLSSDSSPAIKQFVLQVARFHYARSRMDGRLTIYDEQAIQNDILVNTNN
jgi:hypothetical protein